MNFLGIDYGKERVGLATGEGQIKIASPFMILKNKGRDSLLEEIKKIISEENISKVVVGLPLTLKSEESEQTKEVLSFVDGLQKSLQISVETEDERMTSVMVDKLDSSRRKNKERDAVSAMLILQNYFDRKHDATN